MVSLFGSGSRAWFAAALVAGRLFGAAAVLDAAEAPTDNPVAAYYSGDEGYPAWTDRIRWDRVIDMKQYARGRTEFEKFENARDELAAQGGGVLYYPAGTYDFSEGPFDGPQGRGLMLPSGVVIRGQTPAGKVRACDGRMELPTRFVFGFHQQKQAVDVGSRLTLELEGADVRIRQIKPQKLPDGTRTPAQVVYEPAPLILSFPVQGGKLGEEVQGFRRGYGRDLWPGTAQVEQSGERLKLSVKLEVRDTEHPGAASYEIQLTRQGDELTGSYTGRCRDRPAKGKVTGRALDIRPETPREWNLIGLLPQRGKRIKDVNDVGIVWVHLVGATIWFGPDIEWGETWATAGSWKSPYAMPPWDQRRPDGTHPWDPFAGGTQTFVGAGDGRLVFGCVLEDAAVLNRSVNMGRPDYPQGFGPQGFYMHKFAARIAAYGSRVFVANNLLPPSRGRNFKYEQTTRRTFPLGGHRAGYDPPRRSVVFFDYNKVAGIDVNKEMLGYTKTSATGPAGEGYFMPGVVVKDNYVSNHGHKGFNVSGNWVTIAGNHNQRQVLREGYDPERIGGWELTLDGHIETAPGGPGFISDNLSRAFDLGGRNLWVHANTYNNLGSSPGNDGEGILCQAHGGTQVYSWAITYNQHDQGDGSTSYIGGWDVNMAGALFGWNRTPGWIGAAKVAQREAEDVAFVGNQAGAGEKPLAGAQLGDPGGKLSPPAAVRATIHEGDAVKITWKDTATGEVGFRIDRRIGEGPWRVIAYRPPQIQGHPENPPQWIDFLAPPEKPLSYRVVALDSRDDQRAAGEPTRPVVLAKPSGPPGE